MHFQTFDMAGFLSLIIILSISSWQVRPKDRQSLTCLDYIVTLHEIDKEASGYGYCFCLSLMMNVYYHSSRIHRFGRNGTKYRNQYC